jgi:hypothetical protein
MADDNESTYELAVPFICCQSNGGPYDDLSFAAGYQAGILDQEMKEGTQPVTATIQGSLFKQIDLLAMHRGWVLVMLAGPGIKTDDEEWVPIELTRSSEVQFHA